MTADDRSLPHRSAIGWLANQPYLLLSLTSLFWAGNIVLGRYVAGHVPPVTLTLNRWVGAMAILLPLAMPHLRRDWPALRAKLPLLLVLSATGFAINNGVQSGANWVVTLDPADPNHLQVELRYVLPTSATQPDGNGFLGSFNLNILFGAVDSGGATRLYSGSQTFVIRDVASDSDVYMVSADGKSTIIGLNVTPPGANISGGGGDDLIYAGPGHDILDGGTGNNTVSYKYSKEGVTVDLSAGTGLGGYAEGDVLQNFSNIEGSTHADRPRRRPAA